MRTKFEWHTGEDEEWDEAPSRLEPDGHPAKRRPFRRRDMVLALVIGAAVTWFLARGVGQRVGEAEASVEDDLLATHHLIWQANLNRDMELFSTLRAGDGTWQPLDDLFRWDLLLNRSLIGLTLRPEATEITDLQLSPDLANGRLEFTQSYQVNPAGNATTTLRHTWFYERGPTGWQLSPPPDDFWGEWSRYEGERLTVSYSAPDAEIAPRLAADLETVLAQLCDEIDSQLLRIDVCEKDILVILNHNAEVMLSFAIVVTTKIANTGPDGILRVSLPSPTLLGLPQDEVGYEALIHSFAIRMVASVMGVANLLEPRLSRNAIQVAYLSRIYTRLGLLPWPPVTSHPVSGLSMTHWPAQDAALLCLSDDDFRTDLYTYRLSTNTWTAVLTDQKYDSLSAVQNGDAILLHQAEVARGAPPLILGVDGSQILMPPLPFEESGNVEQHIWLSGNVLIGGYIPQGHFAPAPKSFFLLEIDACPDCVWRSLPGRPIMSPDGLQLIISRYQESELIYSADLGRTLRQIDRQIANNYQPFWLDNDTFGYLRLPDSVEQGNQNDPFDLELVTVATNDLQPHILLTTEDLRSALPDDDFIVKDELTITNVAADPAYPDMINIYASVPIQGLPRPPNPHIKPYLFVYDRQSENIRFEPGETLPTDVIGASNDGRYILTFNDDSHPPQLSWHDLESDRIEVISIPYHGWLNKHGYAYESFFWSADNEWLLVMRDGLLTFVALELNYNHTVTPPAPGCFAAAWVNPKR